MDDGQVGLSARAADLSVGQRVAEVPIDFSLEHIQQYEDVVPYQIKTIHDLETLEKSGMAQVIASGSMLVAYTVERLFPSVFYEGWSHRGTLGLSFIRPVVPGNQVTLAADVVAKIPQRENTVIVMKLSATLPNGDVVAAGSASALAAGG